MKKTILLLSLILALSFTGCNSSNLNSPQKDALEASKKIFLPTQKNEPIVMMQARLAGVLEKDRNGCLRVNGDLIIWSHGATLKNNLIYDKNNKPIAEIGKRVVFGGGGFSSNEGDAEALKNIEKASNDLPSKRCSEPYFFVDSVM